MLPKFLRDVAELSVPAAALVVLYLLYRKFDWKVTKIPQEHSIRLVFLVVVIVAIITLAALVLWAPVREQPPFRVSPSAAVAQSVEVFADLLHTRLPLLQDAAGSIPKRDPDLCLSYMSKTVDDRLEILPVVNYINSIAAGNVVHPLDYVRTPFRTVSPRIDIRVVNNTSKTILINSATLLVSSSRIDESPIPVLDAYNGDMKLPIRNFGWGSMRDCEVRFRVDPKSDPVSQGALEELPFKASIPLIKSGHDLDVSDQICAMGVDREFIFNYWKSWKPGMSVEERLRRTADYEKALGPFSDGFAVVSGQLQYVGATLQGEKLFTVHFSGAVNISSLAPRGKLEVTGAYHAHLRDAGTDYKVVVPMSHSLGSGESDRVAVALYAGKSSRHTFSVSLECTGWENPVKTGEIVCDVFQPRSYAVYEDHEIDAGLVEGDMARDDLLVSLSEPVWESDGVDFRVYDVISTQDGKLEFVCDKSLAEMYPRPVAGCWVSLWLKGGYQFDVPVISAMDRSIDGRCVIRIKDDFVYQLIEIGDGVRVSCR